MMLLKGEARQSKNPTIAFLALALLLGGLLGVLITRVEQPLYLWIGAIGILAFVVTIASVEWGLLILVFLTYTRFSDVAIHFHGVPSIARSFVALLAIAFLLRWVVFGEKPRGWERPTILLGIYGLVGLASVFIATDSQRVLTVWFDYLKDAAIAIIVVILLQKGRVLHQVIWALLIAGIFIGTLSVIQYLTGTFTNNYFGFARAEWMNIIGDTDGYRLTGSVGDPNFFAQTMVVLVPLAMERMINERRGILHLLAGWALVVSTLTVIFTFSRGGFVALIVVLMAYVFVLPRRTIYLAIVSLVVILSVALMPAKYIERVFSLQEIFTTPSANFRTEDMALQGRASENLTAWVMFRERPLFGVGWNNYPVLYPKYTQQIGLASDTSERAPHNLYLEVAAESGIIGLMAFGAILWEMVRCLRTAHKKLIEAGLKDYASLVAGWGIAILGYMTAAIFIHAAYPRYLWLLVGITFALPQMVKNTVTGPVKEISP